MEYQRIKKFNHILKLFAVDPDNIFPPLIKTKKLL